MQRLSTRFYTGRPCKYGHDCERMRSTYACVMCLRARKKQPAAKLKEYARKRRKYANDPIYKAKVNARSKINTNTRSYKKWKRKWSKVYTIKNKKRIAARRRAVYLNNPSVAKRYWHQRRARLLGAVGRHTQDDLNLILVKQRQRCLCGVSFREVKPTLDHKVPLSRGGSNWPKNLQFLCQPCNDSKGARTMREWRTACTKGSG